MNYRRLLNTKQFQAALTCAENEVYVAAYDYTKHNQSETARLLGVARGTVIAKLKQLGKI